MSILQLRLSTKIDIYIGLSETRSPQSLFLLKSILTILLILIASGVSFSKACPDRPAALVVSPLKNPKRGGIDSEKDQAALDRSPSSVATLSGLVISKGALSPAFSSNVQAYTTYLESVITSITVTPTSSDSTATITVNGLAVKSGNASAPIPLNMGQNAITIQVTAQDGVTIDSYSINLILFLSANASLANLTFNAGSLSPTFASAVLGYNANVANTVNSVTVTPVASDSLATITVNNTLNVSGAASGFIPLNVGQNTITVKVTAGNGVATRTYTVTITRAASSNAALASMAVSAGTLSPAFGSGILTYTDSVGNSVSAITVTPVAADSTATITVNNIPVTTGFASGPLSLSVGQNVITVQVTAQDGVTVSNYTITVSRAPSSNANLANLTLSTGTLSPAFTGSTMAYSSSVNNNVTSITITPLLADSTASVTVNSAIVASGLASASIPLSVGQNTITVQVTAQDGVTVSSYTITVSRPPSSNANLANLTLSTGTLSPAFAGSTMTYSSTVNSNVTSITITPLLADSTASVTVNSAIVASGLASASIPLSVGQNTITVLVSAQDGVTTNTYTLTVTRAQSSDASLADMAISQGALSPAFSSDSTSYTASIQLAKKDHLIYTIGDSVTGELDVYQTSLYQLLNKRFTIVNFGISGERTLEMVQRFPMVISAAPDYVIVMLGIDDVVNQNPSITQMEMSLQTIYTAAHNAGIKVIALTITPFKGHVKWTASGQAVADTVNAWMPTAANVDYVIDTYAALADPSNPQHLLPLYDSGDHLHPTQAGLKAIANAIYSGANFTQNPAVDQYNAADTSITVTPATSDPNAIAAVNGVILSPGSSSSPIPLSVGINNVVADVTAQDGTKSSYRIKIVCTPSGNANLADLYLHGGAAGRNMRPFFATDSTNYHTSVGYDTTVMQVRATTMDKTATITINGIAVLSGVISYNIPLNIGPNLITTVVTAADGITTKTYTITVNRLLPNNALLNSIVISPSAPKTSVSGPGFANYVASVANGVASVTITSVSQDPGATIMVNGIAVASGTPSPAIPLVVGPNTITTTVTAQNGTTTNSYVITLTRAPSSNAGLSGLAISPSASKTLVPGPGYANYTASVASGISSVTITPTTADPTATVSVNGINVASGVASPAIPLGVGANIITTLVTAQNGTTNSYIITITRAPLSSLSSNALLSALVIKPSAVKTVVPGPGYINYTASVPNAVTSITITPSTIDPTASVRINGAAVASGNASAPIQLAVGTNTITTIVTAQDGVTTKSYIIAVTRAGSSNSLLSALAISPPAVKTTIPGPGFANYVASVPNWVGSVTITATTVDTTARVTVNGTTAKSGTASGGIPLVAGQNTITTLVTAQDGTTRTYIITVTRAPSSNASLSALAMAPSTAKTPVSGPGYANYVASVANSVNSVTITPTTVDPSATVNVNGMVVKSGTASGGIPLVVGQNAITTVVTAQDGVTTKSYIITITRASSSNALLSAISISPYAPKTTISGPGNANYTASVSNAISSASITAISQDQTAAIAVNGMTVTSGTASPAIPLTIGQNLITTVVTAQDGITNKTYLITITRAAGSVNIPYVADNEVSGNDLKPVDNGIRVHQGLSPNGDGINDFLVIDGIDNFPDNKLTIVDRNGLQVFEVKGYDNIWKIFDGHSNKTGKMQSPGTYFYSLDYTSTGVTKHKTGFIILKY